MVPLIFMKFGSTSVNHGKTIMKERIEIISVVCARDHNDYALLDNLAEQAPDINIILKICMMQLKTRQGRVSNS